MTAATDPTFAALLADIIADPADDGLRLIAADWLEEHGQPERAEFIRVQIELEGRPTPAEIVSDNTLHGGSRHDAYLRFMKFDCRWCDREWREQGLLSRHGVRWLREEFYARLPDPSAMEKAAEFRRGFVHTVRCPLQAWLEHGPAVARAHPVERVEATGRRPLEANVTLPVSPFRGATFWGWRRQNGIPDASPDTAHVLPAGVWRLLAGDVEALRPGNRDWRGYDSEAAALDALSAALIAFARQPRESA